MAKKIIAKRPGQTLVVDSGTNPSSADAKGWILDDGKNRAAPVGVQVAIKQGYWTEASGPAPTATYPAAAAKPAKGSGKK